ASGQITQRFDEAMATRVTVEVRERFGPEGEQVALAQLPWDAPERLSRLNGVGAAGTYARVDTGGEQLSGRPVDDPVGGGRPDVPVAAASPGLFAAVQAPPRAGRVFDTGHDQRGDP